MSVGLADDVEGLIAREPGVFGVYARNLSTGETIGVNADRVLPAESAVKTCVLVHYSRLVSSGVLDPTDRVRLDETSRYIGTGVLRYLASGLELTLDDLAWLMVIVSDNTATAMLVQAVGGPAAVNATIRELGCPTSQLNESITFEGALAGEPFSTSSPRDLAEVYTHLDDRCRLFETNDASWVVAAMATEQSDFASRPDDAAPRLFGEIGSMLYDAWSGI